jgi:hypothetical protein
MARSAVYVEAKFAHHSILIARLYDAVGIQYAETFCVVAKLVGWELAGSILVHLIELVSIACSHMRRMTVMIA